MFEVIFRLLLHLYPLAFQAGVWGRSPAAISRPERMTKLECGCQSGCGSTCLLIWSYRFPREYCYTRPEVARASAKTCLGRHADLLCVRYCISRTASTASRRTVVADYACIFSQADERVRQFPTAQRLELCISRGLREAERGNTTASIGERAGCPKPTRRQPYLGCHVRGTGLLPAPITSIKHHHIDPLEAQKAADALLAHERQGDDDSATSTEEFTRFATKQMRGATGDHQLELLYSPRAIPERPSGPPPALPTAYRDEMRRGQLRL